MNDTSSEATKAPTPPKRFTIKRCLLDLTGGEQECPRKRFFISIALVALVLFLVGRIYGTALWSAYQQLGAALFPGF